MTKVRFLKCFFVCFWRDSPQWAMASSFTRFLDHTQRRTKVGSTPLDEWSARRRDFYLTTHTTTHNRRMSMPPVRFEPTISAGERPQTYALDRAATGTGIVDMRPFCLHWSHISYFAFCLCHEWKYVKINNTVSTVFLWGVRCHSVYRAVYR